MKNENTSYNRIEKILKNYYNLHDYNAKEKQIDLEKETKEDLANFILMNMYLND